MKTFEQRINEALGLTENARLRYGGYVYNMGGVETDGSRTLLGPGGQIAGKLKSDGTADVWLTGGDEEQPPRTPRVTGWEVVWERPGTRGTEKQRQFFPKGEEMPGCSQCSGTGVMPGTQEGKQDVVNGKLVTKTTKGDVCTMCYGVGQINSRMNKFVHALTGRGLGPHVKIHRGKPKQAVPAPI